MKSKLIKYSVTLFLIAVSFWFYFQLSTYPYKVARWYQPLEAKFVSMFVKQCSAGSDWLGLFVDHAVIRQGGYSAQVAFLGTNRQEYSCEIGYQKKFMSEPVNASSRYRYASISKLVTTDVILKLISEHKIALDQKLVSFFPEVTEFSDSRVKQITIAHLLNHSAGFDRFELAGDPMFSVRKKPWCPNNLGELHSLRLAFNPGDKQIYSNVGYCLLGEIIHRVTGESYRGYVEKIFSLAEQNIKFSNNYYYTDEVRYDYRYENTFSDAYLNLLDFDALSAPAGLSGSATALAELLWDIHHGQVHSPFELINVSGKCNTQKIDECLVQGVHHYQPEKNGIMLHYHEGYMQGSSSVAVIDSYGGVTVLLKSGANRHQENPNNEWIRWIYKRLTLYYLLQGKLPVLNVMAPHP